MRKSIRWNRKESRLRRRKGWGEMRKTKAQLSREFGMGIYGCYDNQNEENMRVYEQSRFNPRNGFVETIWSHDKHVTGWKHTGKSFYNHI